MNDQQALVFVTIPRVVGGVSMFGSGWICFEVLTNAEKRSDVQQRILLGMATTDVITSFTYVLGQLPFPVEDGGRGNWATCNAQGFFGQLVPSTAIYNAALALYYLATIKYGWRGRKLKTLERACHIIALSFAAITGAVCIALDLFNPAFVHCWIKDYPWGCLQSPDVECTRGDPNLALALGWAFYYVPVWVCGFGIATAAMVVVYSHVRKQEKASLKYSANSLALRRPLSAAEGLSRSTSGDKDGAQPGVVGSATTRSTEDAGVSLRLTHRVAVQGMWYLGAFYATWFWPTVATVLESVGQSHYWILILLAITLPLQGILNWVVYIRPRILNNRQNHKDWSFFYALARVVGKPFGCFKRAEERESAALALALESTNAFGRHFNNTSSGGQRASGGANHRHAAAAASCSENLRRCSAGNDGASELLADDEPETTSGST